MRPRLLLVLTATLLAVTLTACDSDESGPGDHRPATGTPAFRFDHDLSCGFGFARVDEQSRTLLRLYHQPDAGTVTTTVTLPDPGWTAAVDVGTHLDANWCSDVIVDPQAEVDETWEVVEGTLTFVGEVPRFDGRTNEQPVRARLTGVVVEGPEGERVEVGDIALRNTAFGLLPG